MLLLFLGMGVMKEGLIKEHRMCYLLKIAKAFMVCFSHSEFCKLISSIGKFDHRFLFSDVFGPT